MKTIRNRAMTFAGLLFAAMALASQVFAQEAPDALVKRVSQEIIHIATTDKEIQAGNRKRILAVVEEKILPHADFKRATALALGRNWRKATPEQQARLVSEFRNLVIYTYAGAMSQIKEKYPLEFLPVRADAANPDEVEVRFQVRRPQRTEPISVSYRMAKSPDGWKIYDVNVVGVWMSEAYRNTFTSEINRAGIDGLIDTLVEKNRQLAVRADASAKAL